MKSSIFGWNVFYYFRLTFPLILMSVNIIFGAKTLETISQRKPIEIIGLSKHRMNKRISNHGTLSRILHLDS